MSDVSKFIPVNENGESGENNIFGGIGSVETTVNSSETGNTWKTGTTNVTENGSTTGNTWGIGNESATGNSTGSTWKIGNTCTSNNLPAKPTFWSKVKSFFFYDAAELAELEKAKAENVVNETTAPKEESLWTKIVKWFNEEV